MKGCSSKRPCSSSCSCASSTACGCSRLLRRLHLIRCWAQQPPLWMQMRLPTKAQVQALLLPALLMLLLMSQQPVLLVMAARRRPAKGWGRQAGR